MKDPGENLANMNLSELRKFKITLKEDVIKVRMFAEERVPNSTLQENVVVLETVQVDVIAKED